MSQTNPIYLAPLLSKIDNKLIELLKGLSDKDWDKQTIAPKWKVKDIAVHLLDGNLRALSMLRDNYFGETPINITSYEDLIAYLNQLNADWVKAMKRLSPTVIIDLLEQSSKAYCEYMESLNPHDKAVFSVAWAGEVASQNWFHIAREYTEKWHHQQQIRLAVGQAEELLKDEWYLPYLDTSMRALPHHYRTIIGQKNQVIKFTIQGESQHNWFLKFEKDHWELLTFFDGSPTSEVLIPGAIAWRIFTKGIEQNLAISESKIIGNQEVGFKIFDMLAIMA